MEDYNFISLIDKRLDDKNLSLARAIKLMNYHIELYGENSCHIEQDGVEIEF
jgi:hypothetical protein